MHGSEKKHREKCLEWVRCVGFWETWVHKFGVSAQGSLSTMIVFSQSWSLVAVGWTFLKERCITNEQKTTTIYQPPKSNYQLGSPFLSWTWGKLSFLFDFVKVFVAFWLVFILLAFTNSPLVFEIISALRLWLVWDSRSGPTPSLPSTSLEEAGWKPTSRQFFLTFDQPRHMGGSWPLLKKLVGMHWGQQEIPPWQAGQGSEELFHQVEKARSFLNDWASKWVRIEGYEVLLNSASCAIDPDAVLHSTTMQRYVNINLNWCVRELSPMYFMRHCPNMAYKLVWLQIASGTTAKNHMCDNSWLCPNCAVWQATVPKGPDGEWPPQAWQHEALPRVWLHVVPGAAARPQWRSLRGGGGYGGHVPWRSLAGLYLEKELRHQLPGRHVPARRS